MAAHAAARRERQRRSEGMLSGWGWGGGRASLPVCLHLYTSMEEGGDRRTVTGPPFPSVCTSTLECPHPIY